MPSSFRFAVTRGASGLLVAATVAGADVRVAPEDATTRKALTLVQRTYLEPERIDPSAMRSAAMQAAARILGGTIEGDTLLTSEIAIRCPPAVGPDLDEAVGPCLEAILEGFHTSDAGDLPSTDRMRAAMLHSMLRTLDRFSGAYTAGARRNLLGRFTGTGTGVGVRIGRRDDEIRVLEVFPGGGAEEAGLREKDVLTRVAGTAVEGLSVAEVSRLLQGEEATPVEVEVDRDGPLSFTILRHKFVRPTVTADLGRDSIGIVRIFHLSKNTRDQVSDRMQELFRQYHIRRLVLDLRGNSGGSMLAAAAIADLFLREGVLLEALDRNDRPVPGLRERVEATGRGWTRMPVVVLVDGATGSSAELLAAALAWNDRALLIGDRTFGKNIVQKLHHFENVDLTLKISSAYLKAAQARLPGDGLEPDVWIGEREAIEGQRPGPGPDDVVRLAGEAEDPWMEIALEILERHADPSRTAMVSRLRGAPTS